MNRRALWFNNAGIARLFAHFQRVSRHSLTPAGETRADSAVSDSALLARGEHPLRGHVPFIVDYPILCTMNTIEAVDSLSALANETRLRVFRLLVEAGKDGLPSTEIARILGVHKSLMSTHLSVLTRCGLATSVRDGRRIIYKLELGATRDLIGYLVENCCRGQSQQCTTLLDEILPLQECAAIG